MEYNFCTLCKKNKFETKFSTNSTTNFRYKNTIRNQKIYCELVDNSCDNSCDNSGNDFNIYINKFFKNNKQYRVNTYIKNLIMKLFECKQNKQIRTILMLGCNKSENSNLFKLNKDIINMISNVNITLKYYPLYVLVRSKVNNYLEANLKCDKCEENCARHIEVLHSFLMNNSIDNLLRSKRHQNSYKLLTELNSIYGN